MYMYTQEQKRQQNTSLCIENAQCKAIRMKPRASRRRNAHNQASGIRIVLQMGSHAREIFEFYGRPTSASTAP